MRASFDDKLKLIRFQIKIAEINRVKLVRQNLLFLINVIKYSLCEI